MSTIAGCVVTAISGIFFSRYPGCNMSAHVRILASTDISQNHLCSCQNYQGEEWELALYLNWNLDKAFFLGFLVNSQGKINKTIVFLIKLGSTQGILVNVVNVLMFEFYSELCVFSACTTRGNRKLLHKSLLSCDPYHHELLMCKPTVCYS